MVTTLCIFEQNQNSFYLLTTKYLQWFQNCIIGMLNISIPTQKLLISVPLTECMTNVLQENEIWTAWCTLGPNDLLLSKEGSGKREGVHQNSNHHLWTTTYPHSTVCFHGLSHLPPFPHSCPLANSISLVCEVFRSPNTPHPECVELRLFIFLLLTR